MEFGWCKILDGKPWFVVNDTQFPGRVACFDTYSPIMYLLELDAKQKFMYIHNDPLPSPAGYQHYQKAHANFYNDYFESFIRLLQKREDEHTKKNNGNLPAHTFIIKTGQRFHKVLKQNNNKMNNQTFVYAFVEKVTGDIYMPASYTQPAKHVRGNIFNSDPLKGTGIYGIDYL